MSFYQRKILPHVINCACGQPAIAVQRSRVVPQAAGQVLELGIGTGLNAQHYDPDQVEHVIGLDPSVESWSMAEPKMRQQDIAFEYIAGSAEDIPLASASVDSVVLTYTLCTIPEPERALKEVARVLRAEGRVLIAEHARSPDAGIARWQDRLDGPWGRIAGGCHLNRDIRGLLDQSPLRVTHWDSRYLPKTPKIAGFNVWGEARLA